MTSWMSRRALELILETLLLMGRFTIVPSLHLCMDHVSHCGSGDSYSINKMHLQRMQFSSLDVVTKTVNTFSLRPTVVGVIYNNH